MNAMAAIDRPLVWTQQDVGWLLHSLCAMARSERREVAAVTDEARNIARAMKGDHDAFGWIVDQYQSAIADQMKRFSRQPGVIEELVHDVFVEAFISLRSYKSRAPFLHWLRKIAVRTGYRYWKSAAAARAKHIQLSEIDVVLDRPSDDVESLSAWASELLGGLLDSLAPRDRLVLTLLYWDGCSVAQAAELAGWSQAMVKVQAHRARKRLKQLIEETRK